MKIDKHQNLMNAIFPGNAELMFCCGYFHSSFILNFFKDTSITTILILDIP